MKNLRTDFEKLKMQYLGNEEDEDAWVWGKGVKLFRVAGQNAVEFFHIAP